MLSNIEILSTKSLSTRNETENEGKYEDESKYDDFVFEDSGIHESKYDDIGDIGEEPPEDFESSPPVGDRTETEDRGADDYENQGESYISLIPERVKEGDVSRVGPLLRSSRDIYTMIGSFTDKKEQRRLMAEMTDPDRFRWMVKSYAREYSTIPEYVVNSILDLEEAGKIKFIKYKSPAAMLFAYTILKTDNRGRLIRENGKVEIDKVKLNKISEITEEGILKLDLLRYARYLKTIV